MARSAQALLMAASMLGGCRGPTAGTDGSAHRVDVVVAGCWAWRPDSGCLLVRETDVGVWVPAGARLQWQGAVQPIGEARASDGGRLQQLRATGRGSLAVTLGGRSERIAIAWHDMAPRMGQARRLLASGQPGATRDLLRSAPAGGIDAVEALVLEALASEALGDRDGAIAQRRRAALRAVALGFPDAAARQRLALAFMNLYRLRDLPAARAETDEAARLAGEPATVANVAHHRALLAQESGAIREALAGHTEVERQADRLGLGDLGWAAGQARAALLADSGRPSEALALQEKLAPGAPSPCERAPFLVNLGWLRLLAREAGAPSADPAPPAEEALALYRGACAQGAARVANVQVNLALAALQAGQADRARRALAEAGRIGHPRELHVELWRLDAEGRLALADRSPGRALLRFAALQALATRALAPEAGWRAAVGVGRAERLRGRNVAAARAFTRAEALLDERMMALPIGEGRGGLAAARQASAALLVETLLADGRTAEAIAAARLSRARLLAHLDTGARLAALAPGARRAWDEAIGRFGRAREALSRAVESEWSLAREGLARAREAQKALATDARTALDAAVALLGRAATGAPAAPEANELILGYHPAPTGLYGFALDHRGAVMVRLAEAGANEDDDQRARRLLGPFTPAITRATRLRLLSFGALDAIDLHALPFEGRPLGATRVVRYALDLPARTGRRALAGALVVGDPLGDLPAARAEAAHVAARLGASGLRSHGLQAGAATAVALRRALPEADLLHWAGHGRDDGDDDHADKDDQDSNDGWDNRLPLAGGAALTVSDVLALPRVPTRVVLAGCQTAHVATRAGAELGLAQAFVLAGADEVLATTRKVNDQQASALVRHLYQGALERPLAQALHEAVGALSVQPGDWAAFRVLVP